MGETYLTERCRPHHPHHRRHPHHHCRYRRPHRCRPHHLVPLVFVYWLEIDAIEFSSSDADVAATSFVGIERLDSDKVSDAIMPSLRCRVRQSVMVSSLHQRMSSV